ncbi:E3 ubiquitin-protein ligase listerin [Harpegnathos saltator]|uniref:E3 ubiquitin-protein ligase listerin n=1 Tax=Harpegnathos saltator TaxID=610380 RepID=E2BFS0_HARSA|nr:E3 ubiquitin-protein ligase listerin [Harpegnathos saltator]EFN85458.1 Zinc finger protein 294 [Harpegnathos saltator]
MSKSKQAQRTKNNARPSNSSRSAELLGTAMPNFVGFSAVRDGGYVPTLPGLSLCNLNEVEMNSVDPSFQVILKKMNKKYATTKIKALQEFATLCENAELSAVEGMLSFWPRLYCALAIDIDHRVREATQLAHAAVVKRVGKSIAMYLKQLAGTWFISQYDTYPPAASAATNSFNSTFPPWKLVNAIIHCQWEILMYISDNITVQTAQTLSTQKSLTGEEMETIYQRVLVSSLQAYSYYFKKIPSREIENTLSIHEKILTNTKFWKLAKHDVLPIKTAFFNVLTSIIENADQLLQNEKKRVMTTIMNSLDESESGILSAVWEAMLVAITKINDWHSAVSVDKLVLPKLWRVLRSGGQCCASIVYPNLLPFLSQFPKLSVDTDQLYVNFFSNMRQGFSVKSVQVSRSEMQAVITSFIECLRYSVLVNVENVDLCVRLFKEQLVPVLETCMADTENNATMKELLFSEVTRLLRYWSKNRANEAYKSYVPLMQQFWIELRLLFDKLVDVPPRETAMSHTIDAQIELLLTLKKHAPDCNRKKLKVKFASPGDPPVVKQQPEVNISEVEADPVFNAELCEFVNALCVIYFNKINDRQSTVYIGSLNKVMKHFTSRELFVALSTSFQFNKDFFSFYDESLRPLLLRNPETMGQIVELIFHFVAYINDTEKDQVLRSLAGLNDIAITRSVLYFSLSECNRNDPVIKQWYTQADVTKLLIDMAREISSERDDLEKNQRLILLAFETSDNGDALINEDAANEIVLILCDSMSGTDDTCPIQFAQFITRLMTLTWSHKRMISSAVQILETLFELCTRRGHDDGDSASAATVRNGWKEELVKSSRTLPRSEFNDLVKRCAVIFWSKIYSNAYTSACAHIKDTLLDLATNLLEGIIHENDNTQSDRVEETILLFLTMSDIKLWAAEATTVAIYGEVMTGNLYMSSLETEMQIFQQRAIVDLTNDMISDSMATCLKWAVLTTDLLNNLCKKLRRADVNEIDVNASSSLQENVEPYDLDLPGITKILLNIVHVATVAEIYSKHYRSTQHYNDVNKLLDSLKSSFVKLRKHLTESVHDVVLSYIRENHESYGCMLPYIIRTYYDEFKPGESPIECYESCRSSEGQRDEEAYLQGMQVLSNYWTPNNFPSTRSSDVCTLIAARITTGRSREVDSGNTAIMDQIISCHKKVASLLVLNQDMFNVSWEQLLLPLEIIRTLTVIVRQSPYLLTCEQWDYTLISHRMWQQLVGKSKYNYTETKVTALIVAVSQLYYELQILLNKHEQQPMPELSPALLDEWKNVFAGNVYSSIAHTWRFCADLHHEDTVSIKSTVLLDYLGRALSMFDSAILFKKRDILCKKYDQDASVNLDEMLELSLKLLQAPMPSIQLGAYHMLTHIVLDLVEQDKVLVESENFDPSGLSIRRLEAVLLSIQNIVNTMLIEFKLCDAVSCTIQPFTDSYTYTLGYLLAWTVVLDICAHAHGDLRYQHAEILKDELFPCLLNNIFKLMPLEGPHDNKNKTAKLLEIFTTAPSYNFGESWTEWRLDHIMCWSYTNCLRLLPVLVRQWWRTVDSRASATIDKITTHYVSPTLYQEELLNNRLSCQQKNNMENIQVKVHSTAREVIAMYQMDDNKLELSIILPPNYPLGTVKVETAQHVAGTANWRNCHKQLSIFLTHQNGSIWDGLIMWKRNLDKKFAGVEECCICFSIFHISTQKIPKLSCSACRKKFHTPCLYKWFNTSQNSTCPICRNVF